MGAQDLLSGVASILGDVADHSLKHVGQATIDMVRLGVEVRPLPRVGEQLAQCLWAEPEHGAERTYRRVRVEVDFEVKCHLELFGCLSVVEPYVSHRGKGDVDERRYGYTDPRLVPEHIEYVGCVAGAIQKILEHVSFEHVTDASSYLGRLLGVQAAYKVVTVIDKEVATSYEQRRHVAAAVLFHHAHDDIANVLAAVDSFFDDLLDRK